MSTSTQIEDLLMKTFRVTHLELIDDSHRHAGHAESKRSGGGHFDLMIVSPDFEGKNALARHRMIYHALSPIKAQIHALQIKALTPAEFGPNRVR